MKRYLLDTDIVVFLFRNNKKVYNHIKDLIIACTSIVNNMIMVTNNAKHFNRVEGITIENWNED